jgi:hypothetical protein
MWLPLSLVCLFFAAQGALPGISGETMRQRYGPPVSETFLIRPGLVATASYGKNSQVCELFISPQKPTTPIKSADQTPKSIDSKSLTEVINELVPESERGRGPSAAEFLNVRCLPSDDCAGTGSNWEKVSIYRNGGSNDEHYATIQWHNSDCASKTKQ